jgi:hypothetical protein
VNRIQQFRNIPSRFSGSALKSLPERKRISRAEHYAGGSAIFHFPSEKGDFCNGTWPFFALHDQNNFHIFRDLYQRSPLDHRSGDGAIGC